MTAPARDRAQPDGAPELSPKEKRAARERARRAFQARELARMEAERAAEVADTPAGTPAPATAAAPAVPATPERTDGDRARDAALFLRGVLFPLLAVVAGWVGYRLDLAKFTEAQAAEDGKSWAPLLARYPWLDGIVARVTVPARLVARVRELGRKVEPAEATAKDGAKGSASA